MSKKLTNKQIAKVLKSFKKGVALKHMLRISPIVGTPRPCHIGLNRRDNIISHFHTYTY